MLDNKAVNKLQNAKNLLAFSGGVDSSALFYLLVSCGVSFDLAIVDYGIRKQSILEVEYAKELALQYNKKIFIACAPKFQGSFEKSARDFRYAFFDDIINTNEYENLIMAHQLNDRLEWFLMRFCHGGGIDELVGMKTIQKRKNYHIVRPLLNTPKKDIQEFFHNNSYKYFIDETNKDEHYTRNRFRKHFGEPLMSEFANGIKKSFEILESQSVNVEFLELENIAVFVGSADKILKIKGYLPSGEQRKLLNAKIPCVLGGKFAVDYDKAGIGFIAPYTNNTMDKAFREECRTQNIPPKIRAYMYFAKIKPEQLSKMRNKLLQQL